MHLREWIRHAGGHKLLPSWPGENNMVVVCDPEQWNGASSAKTMGICLPAGHHPAHTTVLGGICSIASGDMKHIQNGEKRFERIGAFEAWMQLWYPRLDQVHDCVGIPAKLCPRVVYVCEDSLFGRKVAEFTGLDPVECAAVIRAVHKAQGHHVIMRWLAQHGYPGAVDVVYTSDLERDLDIAVNIFERVTTLDFRKRRDGAKVQLMYTGLWPAVLGISGNAVVYEPAHHMEPPDNFSDLAAWHRAHPHGGDGVNKRLGMAGYMPYCAVAPDGPFESYTLPLNAVPNRANWRNILSTEENTSALSVEHDAGLQWQIANLLFGHKKVQKNGPCALDRAAAARHFMRDCALYYREEF